MSDLLDTFNAVAPAVLVADKIDVLDGEEGKQTVRVRAKHKSGYSVIYHSVEHAAKDVHDAVKAVADRMLKDHDQE